MAPVGWSLACALFLVLLPTGRTLSEQLAVDDECLADSKSGSPGCSLSALQVRASPDTASHESDKEAATVVSQWLDSGGPMDLPAADADGDGDDLEAELGAGPLSYLPPGSPPSDLKVLAKGALPPPSKATQYNGVAWNEMSFSGTGEMHVYTIGDWGGLLWELYPGGGTGLHVFPFIRPGGCGIPDMKACFNESHAYPNGSCKQTCGYVAGVDDHAQVRVAEAMKARADRTGLQYVLNVGDNFYPQGMNTACGHPMNEITESTKIQFMKAFDWVYSGSLAGKPWLSVLGNHDYGARQFNYAWDQQIAYTWANDRWIMPAQFWSQRVTYPDQQFTVDLYMLDSNVMDAHPPNVAPGSNLCHYHYNGEADCSSAGGPSSPEQCTSWFQELWDRQATWMEDKLNASDADWQIAVTHFPCGHKGAWYGKLRRELGLDLLVTGHVHEQSLKFLAGGLTCLVTGGGGGITSERSPAGDDSKMYGFFDLTLTKPSIKVELVNYMGNVIQSHSISQFTGSPLAAAPVAPPPAPVGAASSSATGSKAAGSDATVNSASCTSHPGCANLGLGGDCCPTHGGAMLGCC